jgi:hypothetical protein
MSPRASVFLAAVLLLGANIARAEIIIDQFNTPDDQSLKVTTKHAVDTSVVLASSAIDGWRDISLHLVASQPMYVDVFSDPGAGLFFSQGTGQAYTIVTWAGADTSSGPQYALNANLTSGGDSEFLLSVAKATGTGINVTMTVYTDDGTHSSTTDPLLVTAAGDFSLPFASFIHPGSNGFANFTDIDAIVLKLDGTNHPGSDIALTSLKTTVPEPSTFMLAAVGALVFLGVGRRWRKA